MALTKDKKNEIVADLTSLLEDAKMTVVVKYEGTNVATMQKLRKDAEADNTTIRVVKNRLVIKALQASDTYKNTNVDELKGMLMYAFNSSDEVAPAKVIHQMAKEESQLTFVGAFDEEGNFMSAEEVKALAVLPSREELIASVVNTLKSPLDNVVSGLGSNNLHGLLDALAAKAA